VATCPRRMSHVTWQPWHRNTASSPNSNPVSSYRHRLLLFLRCGFGAAAREGLLAEHPASCSRPYGWRVGLGVPTELDPRDWPPPGPGPLR
jgi:hypothetical protein